MISFYTLLKKTVSSLHRTAGELYEEYHLLQMSSNNFGRNVNQQTTEEVMNVDKLKTPLTDIRMSKPTTHHNLNDQLLISGNNGESVNGITTNSNNKAIENVKRGLYAGYKWSSITVTGMANFLDYDENTRVEYELRWVSGLFD